MRIGSRRGRFLPEAVDTARREIVQSFADRALRGHDFPPGAQPTEFNDPPADVSSLFLVDISAVGGSDVIDQ